MFKLFRFLKPYRGKAAVLLGAIAVQAWTTLMLPAMMAEIINQGIVAGDLDFVWATGVKMIGFAVVSAGMALVSNYMSAKIGTGLSRDIRNEFYAKVLQFSAAEIDKFSTASLITRTTKDISSVQQAMIMCLSMALRAPMMCTIAIIQAIATAADMTWIIALAVVIIFGVTILIMGLMMPKFKIYQKLFDRITLLTRENLTGLRVIRAFNNEETERRKFERTNRETAKIDMTIGVGVSLINPVISLVFNGVTLGCVWIGIILMGKDFSYLGNMMAFMQYAIQVVLSFLFLTMLFVTLPRASVSAKRVNEVLEARPKIAWLPKTAGKPERKASVEFRNVSFSYGHAEEKVLEGVSFRAEAGKTTAFIGSTGSGKSTLINLVPRFFEATSGEVLVNGVNVKEYAEGDLMGRIGYVPQKGRLFTGTVRSNVLFGCSSEERLELAVQAAQAEDFVLKMEKGYDARIAQGGTNVSGGQRQRLAIARAIAKDPDIYIFDDAFSALDMKTDAKLRAALKPLTKEAVTLIVAQRISTIRDAEQIIVLDKGKMVGKGKHNELLRDCDIYREIVKSQSSEEEFKAEMKAVSGKAPGDERASGRGDLGKESNDVEE